MNDRIENLTNSINALTSFDVSALDRSKTFGMEEYRFTQAQNAMAYAVGLVRILDPDKLEFMQEQNLSIMHQKIESLLQAAKAIARLNVGESGSEKSKLASLAKAVTDCTIELAEQINRVAFAFSVYTLDGRVKPKLLGELDEIKKSHTRFNKSIDLSTEKLNKALYGAAQRADQSTANVKRKYQELEKEIVRVSDSVRTFEKQTIERLKLSSLSKLWKTKAKKHKVLHTAMSVVMLITFLFLTQLLLNAFDKTWIDTVVATFELSEKPENWQELFAGLTPKIIAFGLPVAGVIWLARVFLRLFLSNKLLMEDSEQRSVMLDTYLALFEDSDVADADRHLLLNAMFRPLPGETNDIEPPNLAELIKIGK